MEACGRDYLPTVKYLKELGGTSGFGTKVSVIFEAIKIWSVIFDTKFYIDSSLFNFVLM